MQEKLEKYICIKALENCICNYASMREIVIESIQSILWGVNPIILLTASVTRKICTSSYTNKNNLPSKKELHNTYL